MGTAGRAFIARGFRGVNSQLRWMFAFSEAISQIDVQNKCFTD
jgi:hypothetical protein